ncbi:RNA polymerase sigma factor RpoD/SigA [Candidatus Woesearchaeota archaeon]|nr:RNA polymerase sigma factor RpoD/SigA [Candidatus Woesearchaeota archaeon]MBW3021376.1 RNA polymerase sigma factor RpoD/SigA [Candidatus Woesearchaeota archaeon]
MTSKKPRYEQDEYRKKSSSNSVEEAHRSIFITYLREMGEHKRLKYDELRELCRRRDAGDKVAYDKIVRANLKLVVPIAKKYVRQGISLLDLVQEGNRGLMIAAGRYDPEKGFKFSTYASWWIRQSCSRYVVNNLYSFRVPAHAFDEKNHVRNAMKTLESKGIKPTVEALCDETGFSAEKVSRMIEIQTSTSLDKSLDDEGDTKFGERLPCEDCTDSRVDSKDLGTTIAELFNTLTLKERIVIKLRLKFKLTREERKYMQQKGAYLEDGQEHTLQEIGDGMGYTRERIRQIEKDALEKLRHPSRSGRLRDFIA